MTTLREAAERHGVNLPDTYIPTLEDVVDAVDPVEYHGWVLREVLFDRGEPVGHRAPPQPLTKPEQEPVADTEADVLTAVYMTGVHAGKKAATKRQPLTDEEIDALAIDEDGLPNSHFEFARAIERAHGIGKKE